ncbi:MAG TPA: SGNH/GDSL hydrolase family protein [Planctomycetota bacterium]|nr:SGNH/GDSL hydrolase family protein [Planctomycetota bacterium]
MKTGTKTKIIAALAAGLLQAAAFAEEQKPAPAEPAAGLPNVLIIGDSISLGYMDQVKKLLKDKANVVHPPCNCQDSGTGAKNIEAWLGKTKWDVVHFNFGIWDTHLLDNGKLVSDRSKHKAEDLKRRHTTEQYVANLGKVLAALEKSGAKLIWASTTPYVSYGEDTRLLLEKNNAAAKELMDKRGVAVNDLHALALPKLKEWQSKDGCHFTGPGSAELGKQVAAAISDALDKRAKEARPAAAKKE